MILDELEQERCNKNPITINTKCTFGWPGLVEDPEGRGGNNPLTCEHASPSLQFLPSLLSLLPLFFAEFAFLACCYCSNRTVYEGNDQKTFLFSSVAYALYSMDMLHVFFSDIV